MRSFILGLFSLLLLGCSNGNTRVEVATRRPPSQWRGIYVLAPVEIERQEVKAYSQIMFLGGQRAQVMGFDREMPHWGWSATVSTAPTTKESFQVKCESIVVFHTEGKARIVYQQRRGETGKYLSEQEGEKQNADKLVKDSARLDAVVPRSLRRCEEEAVVFHPEVLPEGVVTLVSDQGSLRFLPHDAEAFREMVKKQPEPTGKLESFEPAKGFSHVETGLYASRSNLLMPLAQTHRFYRLRLWSASEKTEGGVTLKGATAARPMAKQATNAWGKSDFLYNQIVRGEWIEPQPSAARLIISDAGVDRAPQEIALTSEGNELVLKALPGSGRLEIVYSIADRTDRELVQHLAIGADGKISSGQVLIRQR